MRLLALKLEDIDRVRARKLMTLASGNLHGNKSFSVSSEGSEMKLKALQCQFTWNIERSDFSGFESETLLFRIRFCPARCHAIYYNILAFVSHLEGDNGTALEFLSKAEEALQERKDDTELLVTYGNYAWVHYHSDNLVTMGVYLKKVEEITKTLPQRDILPLIHGEKGWTFLRLGASLYERSRESFEKALEGEPENVSHNVGYAVVLYRLEGIKREKTWRSSWRMCSKTTIQLDKAFNLEPEDAESEQRDEERSLRLVKKALEIAPDSLQITRYVGKYFRIKGCVEKSLEVFHQALDLAPNVPILHHQIGLCHKQLLKKETSAEKIRIQANECIRYFSRAVELQPSNSSARVDLAEAYVMAQLEDEAERLFKELLRDQNVNGTDLQKCRVCYGCFLMYQRRNDVRAVEQFRLAYQMPNKTSDRDKAGKKLRQLAERMAERGRGMDEWEIMDFLKRADKQQRKNSAEDAARCKMAATAGSKMAATAGSKMAAPAGSKMATTAGSKMASSAGSKMAATAGSKMAAGDADDLANSFDKGMTLK
ncbi:interferon-induced protein with tetratricopeptide repeats 1-like [Aplochiton taeniatus]